MSDLPPGFVLDQPAGAPALPAGFVLDQPSMGADIAKSAGIGLAKGALGLAGFKGDLGEAAVNAGKTLGQYVSGTQSSPTVDKALEVGRQFLFGPTSSELRQPIEQATGPFYQPQTVPGQYAQTVGEFAPAAVIGPESLAYKAGARVLVPAIASETAGQATKGTAIEPYARVAGALVGGAAPGALERDVRAAAVPGREALAAKAGEQYDLARSTGVELKPSVIQGAVQKIQSELNVQGIDENLAPKTFGILAKAANVPDGATFTINNLQSLRRTLGNAAKSIDPTERLAAKSAQQAVDDILPNVSPSDVVSGDPKLASLILKTANANYSAAKLSELVDQKQVRAQLRAQAANSGQNVANTMRQRMADILLNPKERRGYSADELAQMQRIVRGTPFENTVRFAGNLMGGGGGLGALATGGAGAMAAGPAGLALPAVGFGLKQLSNAMTMRQVRKLDQMVRARSPVGQAAMASVQPPVRMNPKTAALISAILASNQLRDPLAGVAFSPTAIPGNGRHR